MLTDDQIGRSGEFLILAAESGHLGGVAAVLETWTPEATFDRYGQARASIIRAKEKAFKAVPPNNFSAILLLLATHRPQISERVIVDRFLYASAWGNHRTVGALLRWDADQEPGPILLSKPVIDLATRLAAAGRHLDTLEVLGTDVPMPELVPYKQKLADIIQAYSPPAGNLAINAVS